MKREFLDMRALGQFESIVGCADIEQLRRGRLRASNPETNTVLMPLRGSKIFDLVEDHNEPNALSILNYVAEVLVDAIASISLLFSPFVAVLWGGTGSRVCLQRELERLLTRGNSPNPNLRTSAPGAQSQLVDALEPSLSAIQTKPVC
jgi:hypothetical protein